MTKKLYIERFNDAFLFLLSLNFSAKKVKAIRTAPITNRNKNNCIIQDIMRQSKNQVKQSMIIKKLGQYGGYLLSGILIAWLINPIAAITFLEFFLKMTLLISIPIAGSYLLDKTKALFHRCCN